MRPRKIRDRDPNHRKIKIPLGQHLDCKCTLEGYCKCVVVLKDQFLRLGDDTSLDSIITNNPVS